MTLENCILIGGAPTVYKEDEMTSIPFLPILILSRTLGFI